MKLTTAINKAIKTLETSEASLPKTPLYVSSADNNNYRVMLYPDLINCDPSDIWVIWHYYNEDTYKYDLLPSAKRLSEID